MFFSASVGSQEKNYNVKYKWTVDKGKIINGQGTTTIQVSAEGLQDVVIYATFEIEGLPNDCVSKDSDAAVIASVPIGEPYEYYEKLPTDEEIARFDAFLSTINSSGKDY